MIKLKRGERNAVQWRRIERLLSGKAGDPGRAAQDQLTFVNGVL